MRLLRLAAAAVALAARADAQTDCTRPDDTAGYVVTETELSVDVGFDVAAACATGYDGTGAAAACARSSRSRSRLDLEPRSRCDALTYCSLESLTSLHICFSEHRGATRVSP